MFLRFSAGVIMELKKYFHQIFRQSISMIRTYTVYCTDNVITVHCGGYLCAVAVWAIWGQTHGMHGKGGCWASMLSHMVTIQPLIHHPTHFSEPNEWFELFAEFPAFVRRSAVSAVAPLVDHLSHSEWHGVLRHVKSDSELAWECAGSDFYDHWSPKTSKMAILGHFGGFLNNFSTTCADIQFKIPWSFEWCP